MNGIISLMLLLFMLFFQAVCSQEKALETVLQEFVDNMGGEELWAETNFLYIKETMWYKQADSVHMEVWLDLTTPKSKIRLKNETLNRVRAFTANRGWGILEDGRHYEFDSLRLKREIANWKRNIYSICRRISLNRAQLSFRLSQENVLEVLEDNNVLLCAIELNKNSVPIKWIMKSEYGEEVTIHGPLAVFGNYMLPRWSTSESAEWQFEYIEVKGYKKAPDISFEPGK